MHDIQEYEMETLLNTTIIDLHFSSDTAIPAWLREPAPQSVYVTACLDFSSPPLVVEKPPPVWR